MFERSFITGWSLSLSRERLCKGQITCQSRPKRHTSIEDDKLYTTWTKWQGDQQIGAMIAERKINMLIFFCDNLIVQGHQKSALTRLAALYNIAFATNRTTADMLLTSDLIDDPDYSIELPDCIASYANRKLK